MQRRAMAAKSPIAAGAIATCLVVALALPSAAELTRPGTWGVGAVAGYQLPVAQEDTEPGFLFGVRGRVGLLRFLELEPSALLLDNQSGTTASGVSLPTGDTMSFGLNALAKSGGVGFAGYATVGVGWSRREFSSSVGNASGFSFNVGIGGEKQIGPVRVDLSPRFYVLATEGGASRKHFALQLGATRYF